DEPAIGIRMPTSVSGHGGHSGGAEAARLYAAWRRRGAAMIFYSLPEILGIVLAAIALDWWIGDARRLPHPVVGIGKLISALERRLANHAASRTSPGRKLVIRKRWRGVLLAAIVTSVSFAATWAIGALLGRIHPWLGYLAHAWLISTTI